MKTKINWAEIESKTDFTLINEKLVAAAAAGGLNRRRSAANLLDKVKDAMLEVRAGGASFAELAEFLKEHGLPVSEPTVREYFRKLEGADKPRKKPWRRKKQNSKPPEKPAAEKPPNSPQSAKPVASKSSVPWKMKPLDDGPRIADPSTL